MEELNQQLSNLTLGFTDKESALINQAHITDQQSLFNLLKYLSDVYTNEQSIVSDRTFDTLRDIYETRFGPYTQVGALPRVNRVSLPYYLGSLNKMEGPEETNRWLSVHPAPHILMDKVDGVSMLYMHRIVDGRKVQKAYTRGTGVIGSDITHILRYLSLPESQYDYDVRGELVIYKADFPWIQEEGKRLGKDWNSPRNVVPGLIKPKNILPTILPKLHFVTYQIMLSTQTPEDQIVTLTQLGHEVAWAVKSDNTTYELLEQVLVQRKREAPYDIDGLGVYQNISSQFPVGENPKHVVAFKTESESYETVVTHVEWEASKDRILVPVVYYEPISIPHAVMRRALVDNARFVVNNGIGPGAVITVRRSKEVLPRLTEVIQPAQPSLPDPAIYGNYTWDANHVRFILTEDNNEVRAARIYYFLETLGVKNVGIGRVTAMINSGLTTLNDVLTATPQRLMNIERFGPVLADKIYNEIQSKIKNVPLAKLMKASNIFPNMGETRFESILEEYPQLLSWAGYDPTLIAQAIQKVKGFNELAYVVANNLTEFTTWLAEHPIITVQMPGSLLTIDNSVPAIPQTMKGMRVVFSGRRHPDIEEQIKARGGTVASSISRNVTYLLLDDLTKMMGKAKDAQRLGIPILSVEDFRRQYLSNSD